MARIIGGILGAIRDALTGHPAEGQARSEQRHDLVEGFLDRRGRLLSMVPLIVIFAVASTNMPAAIWTAFSVQLFIILLDVYRSRYNPKVVVLGIVPASLLASYILVIILYYVLNPRLVSNYVSPIVISVVTGMMLISLIVQYPFTMQYAAHRVDEATRKSIQFFRFNQIITLFWIFMMGCACGCSWASLQFDTDSGGQIVLGIVLPLLFPLAAALLTPHLVSFIKSSAKTTTPPTQPNTATNTPGGAPSKPLAQDLKPETSPRDQAPQDTAVTMS